MSQKVRIKIPFHRGLNDFQEASVLEPGFASVLQNWEPDPSGGLRARRDWNKGTTTSAPATRKCVGIGRFIRLLIPAIVQESEWATGDGTDTTLTPVWPLQTTRGNLLVLIVAMGQSDGATSFTASGWTNAVTSADTTLRPRIAIYYKPNASPESGSVTVQTAAHASSGTAAKLIEVAGILPASPLDATASTNAAADATPDSGTTGATAQAVEFAIGVLCDQRLESQTSPTNGYLQLAEKQIDSAGIDMTIGVYFKKLTAQGAQSFAATTATADNVAGAIATFKSWWTGGAPAADQTTIELFLVAQNDTTEYDFLTVATSVTGSWTNEGSITATTPSQLVAFAEGMGRTWIAERQLSTLYQYDGSDILAVSGSPSGRCVAVHKNRVFTAGGGGEAGLLHYSNLGDGLSWDADPIVVGAREDGETIQEIRPFEDGLLIGKGEGIWFLSGSGPIDFRLTQLNGGNVAPGRTIVATPWGAVLVGRRQVFLWAGGSVEVISRPIETSYKILGDWATAVYAPGDQSLYICDEDAGKIFRLHMPTRAWSTEIIGSGGDSPSVIWFDSTTQFYGPASSTEASLLNWRNIYGGAGRSKDFDALSETFLGTSDEMWIGGPRTVFTPERLFLQIRQRGGDANDGALTITPTYDGVAQTAKTWTPQASSGTYRTALNVGSARGVFSAKFAFSQTLASGEAATLDIEDVELEGTLVERTP